MVDNSQGTVVSAPGKVLFAGGFLVLDRRYTGLVFGLDARIHILIRENSRKSSSTVRLQSYISVESPQFRDARWLYEWTPGGAEDQSGILKQETSDSSYASSSNPFVQTTLEYALIYLTKTNKFPSTAPSDIHITILADDSYYTTSGSPQSVSTTSRSFSDFAIPLHSAHKTGLGSSAALVTSLTAGLISYFNPSSPTDLPKKRIHNLAQIAHCAAQGKVGSGFDVAAAVYGSCLYRRFSPSILSSLDSPVSSSFPSHLRLCVEDLDPKQAWDVEVSSKVSIPKALTLLMCDVDCGSATPGMVKKVLTWRAEKPEEALFLWTALQAGTDDLCAELAHLADLDVPTLSINQQEKLSDIIQTIRALVREMSTKSNVPIEPPVITELLDYCTRIPGVIGGVAPGAGGYDAVALLVRNDVEVVQEIEERLKGWKSEIAGAAIGRVSLLKAKQAYEGVRVEEMEVYGDWSAQ